MKLQSLKLEQRRKKVRKRLHGKTGPLSVSLLTKAATRVLLKVVLLKVVLLKANN